MEIGVPMSLQSSYGTLTFNDLEDGAGLSLPNGNGYLVQAIAGGVYPAIRNPVDNRPNRSGGIVHPFWKGAKIITLSGLVVASLPIYRTTLDDHLRGVTNALLEVAGTYRWTPPLAAQRSHVVRLLSGVEILGQSGSGGMSAAPKQFTIELVAGDSTEGA